ncbi:unnamed protein product [Adineta ricciae]|uniref:G-protein coupled receptors family 1 profile domain-containing protein n=1 Tax=Adineta ricciae TaxID=249248 RepID=A0A815Y4V9_ADIRI|nr:unnamed protein product [Adineta ricciae]
MKSLISGIDAFASCLPELKLLIDFVDLSFPLNIPKFCLKSVWNRNGITFTGQSKIGLNTTSIFINEKNLIYSLNREQKQILIWNESNIQPPIIIPSYFSDSNSLFVALNGDIYIDNGINGEIKKWILNTEIFTDEMNVYSSCFGLFIDREDHLYCSMPKHHRVIKRNLNGLIQASIFVAGTGKQGSTPDKLNNPRGIYVDTELNTFVADCRNNRIQRFTWKEALGKTEVGDASSAQHQYPLSCPTGITFDSQQFLFIVDSYNHRILRSGLNGVHCVIGCDGISIKFNQLSFPSNLAFDSFGNMFVVDSGNNRIQKFHYLKNSCDMSSVIKRTFLSPLTKDSQLYSQKCDWESFYYQSFEIKVQESRYYSIWSHAEIDTYGYIYEKNFDSLNPNDNLLFKDDDDDDGDDDDDDDDNEQFKFELPLYNDTTYILVVTTFYPMKIGNITIYISGLMNMNINRLSTPINIQSSYPSQFTINSRKYCRDYKKPSYYYETLEINVKKTGSYVLWSKSEIDTYGYLYKDEFNPLQPFGNLIAHHSGHCNQGQLKFDRTFDENTKYILVVTTYYPNATGNFTIFISGENNVTMNYFHSKQRSCSIGDRCHFYSTTIGLPLDDILRGEIRSDVTLSVQSISIKISSAVTIIMFIVGFVNSLFSFLTFKSAEERQTGCGLYLFTLSITSFMTCCMFLVNFWFVLLTEIHVLTGPSVLRGGCLVIEPLLKLFLYCDTWLNACVAIERSGRVYSGVRFDEKKSKRIAQCIIFILPLCIMASLIHEPLHRNMFEYTTEINKAYVNKSNSPLLNVKNKTMINTIYQNTTEGHVWCVIHYSSSVQNYNTGILYFHLIIPFLANLFSALFIIFKTARQRSSAQTHQSFREHLRQQLHKHQHLIISPIVLLILTIPRLIISSLPGCIRTSKNIWLYLIAYFFSFTPSIFVFIIFVVPSSLYMKRFKGSFNICRCRTDKKAKGN